MAYQPCSNSQLYFESRPEPLLAGCKKHSHRPEFSSAIQPAETATQANGAENNWLDIKFYVAYDS